MATEITTAPHDGSTDPASPARLCGRLLGRVETRLHDFLAAERELRTRVDARAAAPIDALTALIDSGGKRIRPAFCVAGYLAAGGDPASEDIVAAASALEMLHTCALIHDDVIDASPRRRGLPTVHARHSAEHARNGWEGEPRRYGESVAILAGDLALIYADQMMSEASPSLGAAWAELRSELIIGQFMDVVVAAEFSADVALSRWIAVVKSGRYTIHRPLLIGATLAGRPELEGAFEAYGDALGEAFQLRDDLMDAFGDSDATGKPVGLDIEQHKMTLLMGLAMDRDRRTREFVLGAERDPAEVRRLLDETGVRMDVEAHIDRLVEKGRAAIDAAPLDERWQRELGAMAHQVAYRNS
ncbi:polyprenyl synthetase family protein [Actinomadura sp. DC4]|uniref:polyprenyl synthetase family protein n=1 Tax=Actinomadura sp. DC4 TaxID=3055069 RepID=UPI0025B26373|nr:polyprenyl synthetase family protein [Actinomadura sp. DC4]MDN3353226.1 polyprenyl synthetase family protein [Actinomadura sp. DC4]